MTLLRDLIEIPESVGDADFVVRAFEGADLRHYVVTDQLKGNFAEALAPAVHRSDALLADAARLRERMGDDRFFAALSEGGAAPGGSGSNLAALRARAAGWTAETYAAAAACPPGTEQRDGLVSALTAAFFTGAVRSGEYLDFDTGLSVITRHAKDL